MSQYDRDLKVYADNGLRTADEWITFGREVEAGTPPRTAAAAKGRSVQLYSRDQTKRRERVRPPRKAPAVPAALAPRT
jgi:hypothetical protein